MDGRLRKIYVAILILLYLPVLGGGCFFLWGGRDYSLNQKENSHLIGASYMTMNNEFYEILSEEISNRVEVEGDRLVLRNPALSARRQIEQIDEMLKMGIDVLVLTPVDWTGLSDILRKAKEQGVCIVVVDSDIEDASLADCTVRSDNYGAGEMIGRYFLQSHENAELVVMTHEAARSGQERVQGFLDQVKNAPGIHIVKEVNCDGQLEIAMPKMQEIIDGGTAFDSVFCLNDLAAVGAAAALDENGMLDQVEVYGVDASPDAKALIKEGMMAASAAQFPSRIGQTAADIIYRLLDGETVEKRILVPVELVNRDNVDLYSVDRWQ